MQQVETYSLESPMGGIAVTTKLECQAPRTCSAKSKSKRIPFPDSVFLAVPIALVDEGLLREMGGSELKRYLTLLRLANWQYGKNEIKASEEELEKMDRVAPRTSKNIKGWLEGRGLVQIRKTRPTTYVLISPEFWQPSERGKPRIRQVNPLQVEFVPPTFTKTWEEIGSKEKKERVPLKRERRAAGASLANGTH